jgi:hypothetical protein
MMENEKTKKTSNTPAREVQFLNHDIETEMVVITVAGNHKHM